MHQIPALPALSTIQKLPNKRVIREDLEHTGVFQHRLHVTAKAS